MMSKRISPIPLLIFLMMGNLAFCQKVDKSLQADSISIYKEFEAHGTTARLCTNHNDLDSLNYIQVLVSDEDLTTLLEISSRAKKKKLFQMKYGGPICYWIVKSGETKKRYVAYASEERAGIDDLDNMRRWKISDSKDVQLFKEIINKYWK
jgi:hypothetical protein